MHSPQGSCSRRGRGELSGRESREFVNMEVIVVKEVEQKVVDVLLAVIVGMKDVCKGIVEIAYRLTQYAWQLGCPNKPRRI